LAVAHDAWTESHTGTTGSTSQASFPITNHAGSASAAAAIVAVYTYANVNYITSVTYGGVLMNRMEGMQAIDTTTEPMRCDIFFLANCPTGTQTATITRTNNATVMYAQCVTVTVGAGMYADITGTVLNQNNAAIAERSVNDGSPGTNSLRYNFLGSGRGVAVVAGASSTLLGGIVIGAAHGFHGFRETTGGQGARSVGGSDATSDDLASVAFAVIEINVPNGYWEEVFADVPVVLIPFNDASGDFHDIRSGYDAVVSGTAPTYRVAGPTSSGDLMYGATFVAATDANVADTADIDLGDGSFTIEVWTRRLTYAANMSIIRKNTDNLGTDGYELWQSSAGVMVLAQGDGTSHQTAVADTTVVWNHWVFARSATAAAAYKNGVVSAGSYTDVVMTDNTDPLWIGVNFEGDIAALAIYKSQLSAARALAHYRARLKSSTLSAPESSPYPQLLPQ
jgi:hypothetical protein